MINVIHDDNKIKIDKCIYTETNLFDDDQIVWSTECGKLAEVCLGLPSSQGYLQCPYCGKSIEIKLNASFPFVDLFVSRRAAAIFILLTLDGKSRNRLLGISKVHYHSSAIADAWLNDIQMTLSDITLQDELGLLALEQAKMLHKNMIS